MFTSYFHQTLNYLKLTSTDAMSDEQREEYYKIPSTPLQKGKNSLIFTRSQCLGNNLCSANCLVHKKRKRRPKATVNSETNSNLEFDLNESTTSTIDSQLLDQLDESTSSTTSRKMSTAKRRAARYSQLSDDECFDETVQRNVNRYNYFENFSLSNNRTNHDSSHLLRQSIIFPFLIGLLIVFIFSIYFYSTTSQHQQTTNSIIDLNESNLSFLQNEQHLDKVADQLKLQSNLRAIETFKQELQSSFSQLNQRINQVEHDLQHHLNTQQQLNRRLIDRSDQLIQQVQKQDEVIVELNKYKIQMDKLINEFSLVEHDELKSKFNDIRQLIKKLIKEALDKYDADKTGIVDFASEYAGGEVVSTGCTESYDMKGASYKIFGVPIWSPMNTPRIVIQPSSSPGQCWYFRNNKGSLVIKLSRKIIPSNFSYEHIPIRNAIDGHINSAPKLFEVRGLNNANAEDNWLLGEFEYDNSGEPLQYFKFENTDRPIEYVEFNILNNHGNEEFTCLYRIRVHGIKVDKEE